MMLHYRTAALELGSFWGFSAAHVLSVLCSTPYRDPNYVCINIVPSLY